MKHLLLALAISLVHGFLAYFMSSSLFLGILTGIIYLFTFFIGIVPCFTQFDKKEKKRHEAYHFVNSFIISLSVSNSPETAFNNATNGIEDEELNKLLDHLSSFSIKEKLDYLGSYFNIPYYPMFLSIYQLSIEQGGDLLKLADPLLKEITRSEESGNESFKESSRRFMQFVSLWFMSSLILVFLRFGLKSFYETLVASKAFLITAMAYFIFALISFLIFSFAYTGERPNFKKESYEKSSKSK
jgi:hypothetical protein